jgi:hypothetical protein
MSTLPLLNEQAIQNFVGRRSLAAGKSFLNGHALCDPCRQACVLKARCPESQGETCHVQVTLDERSIASASCSCRTGTVGPCRHIAALLLAWQDCPEKFTELEAVETALERRSRPELIALCQDMLQRAPALERLLEAPSARAVNPDTYRRQAEAALRQADYGYRASDALRLERKLDAMKETGDSFMQQKEYASAAAVYAGLSAAAIANFVTGLKVHDGDDLLGLGYLVFVCLGGLDACLEGLQDDPIRRMAVLRALWEGYQFEVERDGIKAGANVASVLLVHTTAEERRTVARWVRAKLRNGAEEVAIRRRRAFRRFALVLESDTLDDVTYLHRCRQAHLYPELVSRLLQVDRPPDAGNAEEQALHDQLRRRLPEVVRWLKDAIAHRYY